MTTTPTLRRRNARSATPTVRQTARRWLFWIVIAVVAILICLLALALRGGGADTGIPLSATNPAPAGAQAIVAVLRQHGVKVEVASTLDEAKDAAGTGSDATILLSDPSGYLSAGQLEDLADLGGTIVAVQPGVTALKALAPGVSAAGAAKATTRIEADCSLDAAAKASRITGRGQAYRITGGRAQGCFATGGDAYALVHSEDADRSVDVLGSSEILANETIALDGNAALALNLLGSHRKLVWYLPTIADVPVTGPPSLAELTPGWVTPVVLLFIAVALAAAIWRGRRFGPLVVENLPVLVRSRETMEGRARLYQRSSARLRALDALRVGTIGRIAGHLGLPRLASVSEVADAAASALGADPAAIRGILLDARPRSDADLIASSDRLLDLESQIARTARPSLHDQPDNLGRMNP